MKYIFAILSVFISFASYAAEKIDHVVINKADRKMELLSDSKVIKTYDIMLGANPVGAKQIEGDKKTPEGEYIISGRNPGSQFHRSLRISYPNKQDIDNAKKLGKSPGGDIMIHGLPNGTKNPELVTAKSAGDWTWGCISVTNKQIEEIWDIVPNGTRVTINP
jgi:murein L,D-transpeptidase YafK